MPGSGGSLPASTGPLPGSGSQFKITDYAGLGAKKATILQDLQAQGATPQERDLVMAVAMQETTDMDPDERDGNKSGSSANASIFNMNADMLKQLGYTGDINALNDPSQLSTAVHYMLAGIRTWGQSDFLDFMRGGSTGFADHTSYDCAGYRNAIGTIMQQFQQNPSLLSNDDRVEINVAHQ